MSYQMHTGGGQGLPVARLHPCNECTLMTCYLGANPLSPQGSQPHARYQHRAGAYQEVAVHTGAAAGLGRGAPLLLPRRG